jgi:hypothetical protein
VNGYAPKVGDKVRATLGESVIVGKVAEITMQNNYPVVVDVFVGPHTFDNVALIAHGSNSWLFEQVVSVPTKFGAVIRRADGEMLILRSERNKVLTHPWRFVEGGGMAATGAEASAGGFTVLFEGVDE